MFVIEDELHAEPQGEFASFDEAMAELRRRSDLPWDEAPNVAPCTGWKKCGRRYEVIEYDASSTPWKEIRRQPMLEVSAVGAVWLNPAPNGSAEGKET